MEAIGPSTSSEFYIHNIDGAGSISLIYVHDDMQNSPPIVTNTDKGIMLDYVQPEICATSGASWSSLGNRCELHNNGASIAYYHPECHSSLIDTFDSTTINDMELCMSANGVEKLESSTNARNWNSRQETGIPQTCANHYNNGTSAAYYPFERYSTPTDTFYPTTINDIELRTPTNRVEKIESDTSVMSSKQIGIQQSCSTQYNNGASVTYYPFECHSTPTDTFYPTTINDIELRTPANSVEKIESDPNVMSSKQIGIQQSCSNHYNNGASVTYYPFECHSTPTDTFYPTTINDIELRTPANRVEKIESATSVMSSKGTGIQQSCSNHYNNGAFLTPANKVENLEPPNSNTIDKIGMLNDYPIPFISYSNINCNSAIKDDTLLNTTQNATLVEGQVETWSAQPSKSKRQRSVSGDSLSPLRRTKRTRVNSAADEYIFKVKGTKLPDGHYKCLICNKLCNKIYSLKQHINVAHSDDRLHRCDLCGKRFKTNEDMQIHLQRHTAINKEYKCSQCVKQYHRRSDLNRHIKEKHEEKLFGCHLCQKTYSRNDHLAKHIHIHLNPKRKGKQLKKCK
uniref:C2H2-type domain-containing protein n=1 Tax=Glossina brevipalpis TaxID=37001 RepID=A0A1A9WXH9_9MUSC